MPDSKQNLKKWNGITHRISRQESTVGFKTVDLVIYINICRTRIDLLAQRSVPSNHITCHLQ